MSEITVYVIYSLLSHIETIYTHNMANVRCKPNVKAKVQTNTHTNKSEYMQACAGLMCSPVNKKNKPQNVAGLQAKY